jgi:flagellin
MSLLTINHNVSAMNTQRNLNISSFDLSKSLQKLSSGYRINTASDGPADLVISEGLRAQIGGLNAALRNSQEASNYVGIAEGALNQVNALLVSMRGLSVHAKNAGVVTTQQIAADQAEMNNALSTIDRIGQVTRFASKNVFGHTAASNTFQIGERDTANDRVSLAVNSVTTAMLNLTALATSVNHTSAVARIDTAINTIATMRATMGAFVKNTLQSNINSLSVSLENVTATESYIRDTNMAEETSNYTKNQILVQAGVSVLAQANVASQSVLALLR